MPKVFECSYFLESSEIYCSLGMDSNVLTGKTSPWFLATKFKRLAIGFFYISGS